ncbi:MAG TPA: glycosyltransferase, partial [Actinoplanes sp.]|nr:glycosyltransferase [Actinoplanes sp.]
LVRRELLARGAGHVVASNNACLAVAGARRTVLLRNALHFLYPHEEHLLRRLPRSMTAQIPVVRRLLARADVVVVPATAMAERVIRHAPRTADRIVVRPHPVTPVGRRQPATDPFVLVPVVPGPYKNLVDELRALVAVTTAPMRLWVTAQQHELPADLAEHPQVVVLGRVPVADVDELWRTASAVFYPSTVEAFGYPLAEARANGVAVIAPDSAQTREIAGPALRGYRLGDPDSLRAALAGCAEAVEADPEPFAREPYFRWLLGADRQVPAGEAAGRLVRVDR